MEGARQSTSYNGAYLILWGCLLAAAETVTHLEGVGFIAVPLNLVWAIAVGIGFGLSALPGRRAWLRAPVNSLVDRMLAAIWVGCAVGLTVVGFLGSGGSVTRLAAPGVTAVFFGSAFFASSFLPGRTAFLLLAAGWWTIGGALLIWPFSGSRLVIAAALILFALTAVGVEEGRTGGVAAGTGEEARPPCRGGAGAAGQDPGRHFGTVPCTGMTDYDYRHLDPLVHSRIRLSVLAILASVDDAEFTYLRLQVKATDGNLGAHLRKLEDAGYLRAAKGFVDRKPMTRYRITAAGRRAFRAYVDHLERLLRTSSSGTSGGTAE